MNQTRRLMSSHHLDDYYDDLLEAQEKITKLEGWLELLYYHHCDDRETDKTLQEISDFLKAKEGK